MVTRLQLVPALRVIHREPWVPRPTPCVLVSNPTREKPCPRPVSETCQPCPVSLYRSGPKFQANRPPTTAVTPCGGCGGGVAAGQLSLRRGAGLVVHDVADQVDQTVGGHPERGERHVGLALHARQ